MGFMRFKATTRMAQQLRTLWHVHVNFPLPLPARPLRPDSTPSLASDSPFLSAQLQQASLSDASFAWPLPPIECFRFLSCFRRRGVKARRNNRAIYVGQHRLRWTMARDGESCCVGKFRSYRPFLRTLQAGYSHCCRGAYSSV